MSRTASAASTVLPSRLIVWPVKHGAVLPAWPPKYPSEELTYTIDFSVWLADAQIQEPQLEVLSYGVAASSGFDIGTISEVMTGNALTGISVDVRGGLASITGTVQVLVALSSGRVFEARAALPVLTDAPSPLYPPIIDGNAVYDSDGTIAGDSFGIILVDGAP